MRLLSIVFLAAAAYAGPILAAEAPDRRDAAATLDLATDAGIAAVKAQWRYHDTELVPVKFRAAGADQQPGGKPVMTWDYTPHAGPAEYDDSKWPVIAPATLSARRGNGRLSFNWYRIKLTVPERVGVFDTRGSTVVFEATLDDAAEIWVDGELPRSQGQRGGSVVAGWNAPNRLVIARDAKPGQQIQLAVFGINGPLSTPPTNYIYVKSARLEFHRAHEHGPRAVDPHEVNVEVIRHDPALDAILPANPKVFALAEGFQFTEGPVWLRDESALLFSDPNANTIYRWSEADGLRVFRTPSGYGGADIAEYRQPGSNGLTLDREGRLTINQHGNRRVIRLEGDGSETVIADREGGRRLNSPNDLVYKSDGSLYFTDPFFGLPKFGDDPRKELPHQGVYRVKDGAVTLLTKQFSGPNGIAFSPDEKHLYVGDWDDHHKVVVRFPVNADGTLGPGEDFADLTKIPGEDAIDGVKVDTAGNVYISGPGGLHIYSRDGKALGTIVTPRHAHNFAWGDADGKTLYLCARDRLYRIRLNLAGVRP
jgi:gluconolactonase